MTELVAPVLQTYPTASKEFIVKLTSWPKQIEVVPVIVPVGGLTTVTS